MSDPILPVLHIFPITGDDAHFRFVQVPETERYMGEIADVERLNETLAEPRRYDWWSDILMHPLRK